MHSTELAHNDWEETTKAKWPFVALLGGVGHNYFMHYVYILSSATGMRYVGYSHDLKRRLDEHQRGEVKTTMVFQKAELIWYCSFGNKKKALDFEKYLKKGSGYAFANKHLV